jgi:hypothetical protein
LPPSSRLLELSWLLPPLLAVLFTIPLWGWSLVRRASPPLWALLLLPLLGGLMEPSSPVTRAEILLLTCTACWPSYAGALALGALLQPGEPAPVTYRRLPGLLLVWGLNAWASLEGGLLVLPFYAVSLLGLRESPRLSRVWAQAGALQLAALVLLWSWFSNEPLGRETVDLLLPRLLALACGPLLAGAWRLWGVLLYGGLLGWLGALSINRTLSATERELVSSPVYDELPVGVWWPSRRTSRGYVPLLPLVPLERVYSGRSLHGILVVARADELLGPALRFGLHLVYRSEPGSIRPLSMLLLERPSQGILIHPGPDGGFVYDGELTPEESPVGCGGWDWMRVIDPAEPWTAQQLVSACAGSSCTTLDTVPACIWTPEYGWHYPDEVADCVGP